MKAQEILRDRYKIAADVRSVTSFQELYRDAHAVDRWNRLHPSDFFEVDARFIVVATLRALASEGALDASVAQGALAEFAIDPERVNPAVS